MRNEGARPTTAVRLRRFWARRLAVALALFALAPLAAAASELPSDAAILDAFGKIAFGNEYVAEADPRLQKWTQPIRWRIYQEVFLESGERDFLDRHLERLKRLTGLGFSEADRWPESNFLILFVSEDRYAYWIERYAAPARRQLLPRLAATSCLGFLRHHRVTFEIELAVAIVPVERARARGLMTSCIAEETTQVLGLLNDTDARGTLFNDKGDARDLTPLDEMLVRLLYDARLKPGMLRDEALAIAGEVLPKLRGAAR
jgi:hypothetical protein